MTRTLLSLTGADRVSFLQGLVTNDVTRPGLIYAALLTPQGKFMVDFFILAEKDSLLIDVASSHAAPLNQRLSMYKLRADVTLALDPRHVHLGLGTPPADAYTDPRTPEMGWRAYRDTAQTLVPDLTETRINALVPETGIELTPDSYILEMGFERLNGVDFKKGCYVGQEVTARMKHKTDLKKGLARVSLNGPATPGTEISANDKPAGTLHSVSGNRALAYLRFDRAQAEMTADTTKVTRDA